MYWEFVVIIEIKIKERIKLKRTAEFTLSLIATIFLTIGWFFTAIFTFFYGFTPADEADMGFFYYLLIYTYLSIPLLVLIWVATFKVKANSKGWEFSF